jgi:hypothetical protein
MNVLTVEEYHVTLARDGERIEGNLWVREGEEWELEAQAGEERLTAEAHADAEMTPASLFERMVANLEPSGILFHSCGTCANFRRSPQATGGWMGYCSYRGGERTAPPLPGEVALLAPSCPAFQYSGPNQPAAEWVLVEQEESLADPEATRALPAATEKEDGKGLFGSIRRMLGLKRKEPEMVRAGVVERPGGQPCPVCGTRMTNRASIANADQRGEERVLSVWRCPHCQGNYLDDWFEAYVGSKAHDAERLYVVPPVEANAGAAIVVNCPRPDVKGCTCIANQFFDEWGNRLEKEGRRIKARESVVSF